MADLPCCKVCKSTPLIDGDLVTHRSSAPCAMPLLPWMTPYQWMLIMGEDRDINAIANRVCGDIPEDFVMQLYMENGYGGIELFHKDERVEIDMADWKIHEQVNVAFQCIAQIIEEQGNDN